MVAEPVVLRQKLSMMAGLGRGMRILRRKSPVVANSSSTLLPHCVHSYRKQSVPPFVSGWRTEGFVLSGRMHPG